MDNDPSPAKAENRDATSTRKDEGTRRTKRSANRFAYFLVGSCLSFGLNVYIVTRKVPFPHVLDNGGAALRDRFMELTSVDKANEERENNIRDASLWRKSTNAPQQPPALTIAPLSSGSSNVSSSIISSSMVSSSIISSSIVSSRRSQQAQQHSQLSQQSPKLQCSAAVDAFSLPSYDGCRSSSAGFVDMICAFQTLQIDASKIRSDRGGEPLQSVMGRGEPPEFPVYTKGAFTIKQTPRMPPTGRPMRNLHHVQSILDAMQVGDTTTCETTWPGTTLLVTRYEYVNLFHTTTDWWNTFFVLPHDAKQPINIVFLDAHAEGILDPVWTQLFANYTFVKHLPHTKTCFERAIVVPPGYDNVLFRRRGKLPCDSAEMVEIFAQHVLQSYHLEDVQQIPGKVIIIDRVPFISHPRAKAASFERILRNFDELQQLIQQIPGITSVHLVRLEQLPFAEQVREFRSSQIVIANHGAGLTHLLYAHRSVNILELSSNHLNFFAFMSQLKGIHHEYINMRATSNRRIPQHAMGKIVGRVRTLVGA